MARADVVDATLGPFILTGSAPKDMSSAYVINVAATVLWDGGLFGIGDDAYFTNLGHRDGER